MYGGGGAGQAEHLIHFFLEIYHFFLEILRTFTGISLVFSVPKFRFRTEVRSYPKTNSHFF
jgi:hypothetical protein